MDKALTFPKKTKQYKTWKNQQHQLNTAIRHIKRYLTCLTNRDCKAYPLWYNTTHKMTEKGWAEWRENIGGLKMKHSGRVSAWHAQSPDFNPQYGKSKW